MNGPKFRFTVVVGFLLVLWWVWNVSSTYLWGSTGLNFVQYGQGVVQLAAAAIAGFGLVWLAVYLAGLAQNQKTGFEAEVEDEYGTIFRMGLAAKEPFPMTLAKFLPDIMATPNWSGLIPLEAEIFGFLNGYRHWPADLKNGHETLYTRAYRRWLIMRDLPGAGPWHRVMALASDMSKIYAYKEVRSSPPLRQFWKRDRIRFDRKTQEHGGLSAFILSTLPGFRALALETPDTTADTRRALLAALRYMDDPRLLPTNISPLAREFLDYWQRAEGLLARQSGKEVSFTDEDLVEFKKNCATNLPSAIKNLNISDTPSEEAEALLVQENRLIVRPESLLNALALELPSSLRLRLQLWEGAGARHATWVPLLAILREQGVWVEELDGMNQPEGGWMFQTGQNAFGPGVLLDFTRHAQLQHFTENLPGFDGQAQPQLSTEDIKILLQAQAQSVQDLLSQRF